MNDKVFKIVKDKVNSSGIAKKVSNLSGQPNAENRKDDRTAIGTVPSTIDSKSIAMQQLSSPSDLSVTNIKKKANTIDDKSIAMNQLKTPAKLPDLQKKEVTEEKTNSWDTMLANLRKSAEKEKTDAVKMQKYHALTDVFNAIGKMGGAVVGGAIGGNILDSAPNVGEYKESRGYLDAFENAKKANERLRALDAQEFQLAYETQKRKDDRAYDAKVRETERTYKTESDRLNREWTAEQNRINREWQKAVADKDFERQAALKKELATMEQNFKLQYQKINNAHEEAMKTIGLNTVQKQYDLYNPKHPIMFRDGSTIDLTTNQISDMMENYKGQTIGGVKITEDNFGEVLRSNPNAFKGYLESIGASPLTNSSKSTSSKTPWWNKYASKSNSSAKTVDIDDDLAQYEVTI